MHVSNSEIRRIFASDVASAFFTPQQRERALGALDRHMAQEAEDKSFYENVQRPFIEETLPEMIKEFSAELKHLEGQQWENASFARAVKVLTNVEQKWDELKSKGLQALFKANFLFHFNRGFCEPLITRLVDNYFVEILMNDNRAQIESEKLTALFNQYQPDAGNEGITVEEKTKALAFLIFAGEAYMNQ